MDRNPKAQFCTHCSLSAESSNPLFTALLEEQGCISSLDAEDWAEPPLHTLWHHGTYVWDTHITAECPSYKSISTSTITSVLNLIPSFQPK